MQQPPLQYPPIYERLEEDLSYLEPVETGVIIPPELPEGTKFDITSAIIHLLNLKGVFLGLPTDDTNMHVMSFMGI